MTPVLGATLVATVMFAAVLVESAMPKAGSGMVAFWAPAAADLPAAAAIAEAAEGRIARPGGFSGWWVVATDSDGRAAELYRAGAWLVVDAKFLSACARAVARVI